MSDGAERRHKVFPNGAHFPWKKAAVEKFILHLKSRWHFIFNVCSNSKAEVNIIINTMLKAGEIPMKKSKAEKGIDFFLIHNASRIDKSFFSINTHILKPFCYKCLSF